ncbi:hypothetical protein Nepgr_000976 [Nepenthes gracilis]|uniref:Integrase catalytic domain-containing protein n=1 Tax=Nepenthes gracilis TaxID=150966 RepID=A0AAD3P7R3_NEPGR|nr:hypothetical protein Nepgr_000976 [Nepenthes gracilis]
MLHQVLHQPWRQAGPHFGGIPQANGQVEVTNRTLFHRLKTKLEDAGGSWADEFPSVLRFYRTTPKEPTRKTPFSLCYGTEAVISVSIGLPSLRVESFDSLTNSQKLKEHLDLLEEARDVARETWSYKASRPQASWPAAISSPLIGKGLSSSPPSCEMEPTNSEARMKNWFRERGTPPTSNDTSSLVPPPPTLSEECRKTDAACTWALVLATSEPSKRPGLDQSLSNDLGLRNSSKWFEGEESLVGSVDGAGIPSAGGLSEQTNVVAASNGRIPILVASFT